MGRERHFVEPKTESCAPEAVAAHRGRIGPGSGKGPAGIRAQDGWHRVAGIGAGLHDPTRHNARTAKPQRAPAQAPARVRAAAACELLRFVALGSGHFAARGDGTTRPRPNQLDDGYVFACHAGNARRRGKCARSCPRCWCVMDGHKRKHLFRLRSHQGRIRLDPAGVPIPILHRKNCAPDFETAFAACKSAQ